MNGRNVCYHHGGKTPRGKALPQTKSGRWSRDLPTNLVSGYEASRNDPELMNVRQDVHLLDTLLLENLKQLDTGESAQAWELLRKTVKACRLAYKNEDYGRLEGSLDDMQEVIDRRIAHHAAESEIRSKLEQRRKLIETHEKINLQAERVVTSEQLMLFIGALFRIIEDKVPDAKQRYALANEIEQLIIQSPQRTGG